jgi:hypothetical protein
MMRKRQLLENPPLLGSDLIPAVIMETCRVQWIITAALTLQRRQADNVTKVSLDTKQAKYEREPTQDELITAHHFRYNQDHIDFCMAFEEIYEKCMQTGTKAKGDKVQREDEDSSQVEDEDMEDQVAGEEMVDDSLPDVGLPLPDL